MSIRGLSKTFGGSPVDGSGGFVAVDELSFDMHEGQIFSLLGHNGAGKTTTINMLTGLFPPDSGSGGGRGGGSARVRNSAGSNYKTTIYGSDIVADMPGARRKLGVCPQHDVLFDRLTAREHVAFFALLKGGAPSWAAANAEADDLLAHFHLQERAQHCGSELSGGMKRKLSTAVALCGGSKFVVLDEPTAGMDPLARRELWDLLKAMRAGRTMLLTTHYMDEADVLGDRIGIMSRGQLQCLGSSTFLKHTFGAGYKLICTMEHGAIMGAEVEGGIENVGRDALEDHPKTQAILHFIRSQQAGVDLMGATTATPRHRKPPLRSLESSDLSGAPQRNAMAVMAAMSTDLKGAVPVSPPASSFFAAAADTAASSNSSSSSSSSSSPPTSFGPLSLSKFVPLESSAASLAFVLPFDAVGCFGAFFASLDGAMASLAWRATASPSPPRGGLPQGRR